MSSNPFLEAALQYAGRGWRCFPIKPRDKVPLVKGGFKAATVVPSQLEAWWSRWPNANIGVATGQASGLLVVDIDSLDALRRFKAVCARESRGEPLYATAVSITARGWHLCWHLPQGDRIPCTKGWGDEEGIDIRADGGYICVPPSIHPSGHVYRWDRTLVDGTVNPPLFDLVP